MAPINDSGMHMESVLQCSPLWEELYNVPIDSSTDVNSWIFLV
jgi:hypothetical protein